jgi:ABC-type nitrate/sulfonate/bicarbonate transport system substrate-binding protein
MAIKSSNRSSLSPVSPSASPGLGVTVGAPLRIGFLPLTDASPLIVAQTQGFFTRRGLDVRLSREVGWATVRDKIIYRELDASHAVAPMVMAATLGLGCLPTPCITAYALNAHGNAITLSTALWRRGVRDAGTLLEEIVRTRHERLFVFGVVFACSAQNIILRDWLRSARIDPDKDVRIVVVPPAQLHRNLAAGTLDGYCVGDPWNSLAVREKTGWIAATSAELSPGHAEKIFMVREDFAVARAEEHLALIAALAEAAILCDDPGFRPELVKLLARVEYLGLPARVIAPALVGPFALGADRGAVEAVDYIRFHSGGANVPAPSRAQWIVDGLVRHGLIPKGQVIPADLSRRVFRSDIFAQARARHGLSAVV